MLEKLKAWCRHSLTIAWARSLYVAGVALEVAAQCADFLTAIGAGAFVPPKYAGVYTVVLAAVTEFARRRSLKKEV